MRAIVDTKPRIFTSVHVDRGNQCSIRRYICGDDWCRVTRGAEEDGEEMGPALTTFSTHDLNWYVTRMPIVLDTETEHGRNAIAS